MFQTTAAFDINSELCQAEFESSEGNKKHQKILHSHCFWAPFSCNMYTAYGIFTEIPSVWSVVSELAREMLMGQWPNAVFENGFFEFIW